MKNPENNIRIRNNGTYRAANVGGAQETENLFGVA